MFQVSTKEHICNYKHFINICTFGQLLLTVIVCSNVTPNTNNTNEIDQDPGLDHNNTIPSELLTCAGILPTCCDTDGGTSGNGTFSAA